jgi:uncharacterized protein
MKYCVKDFIEAQDQLLFAVVESGMEAAKVLCFLRYAKINGFWQKLSTEQADRYLADFFPHYLYYSSAKDVSLHAVSESAIIEHYQPKQRLQMLMQQPSNNAVERDFKKLLDYFIGYGMESTLVGVTGSLLPGVHNDHSDIDLVFYDRQHFHFARNLVKQLIDEQHIAALDDASWESAYSRRSCHIDLADYVWHEQRKFNKALINGRKFDISLAIDTRLSDLNYQKKGLITMQAKVIDDTQAFDSPAVYVVEAGSIDIILCFTATYVGQACTGEWIEVSGMLEESPCGHQRIVVGSSREAPGEFIRVIR